MGLLGLGDPARLDQTRLLNALQIAFRALPTGSATVAIVNPGNALDLGADRIAAAAVEAAIEAGFSEGSHKTRGEASAGIAALSLVGFPRIAPERMERAALLAEATNLARELVNLPASELSPPEFARRARSVARAAGLTVEVLGRAELRRRKYGALLAVGGGSVHPPQLVVLRYAPKTRGPRPATRLALVGKGITFDSGGIDIKPADGMQFMKGDLGGAAAVLGAMKVIAELKPDIEVIGILATAENMVSGTAMRPGDVIRTGSGRTVEVINTDAEGRLVLADCLAYARREGAQRLVDVATLTGGIVVALGSTYAGLMSNDETWAAAVQAAARRTGEIVWRMPLHYEYADMIKGRYGQIINATTKREATALTAGEFLHHFAGEVPWAHLDIAGTAWDVRRPYFADRGATGFGVRLLVELALSLAADR